VRYDFEAGRLGFRDGGAEAIFEQCSAMGAAQMIETLVDIAARSWSTLEAMAPYLLFGFLVAGTLSVMISPETVERHLGRRSVWGSLKAALFGVPLPLCSCGVIPVAASLRRHGASRGATTAFLLSTPQTGVDSIFVTFSILGPVFTVVRPLVAFVSGVLGGAAVDVLDRKDDSKGTRAPIRCEGECCNPQAKGGKFVHVIKYGFVTLPRDIGKALLVGILIAGVISAVVPGKGLGEYLGAEPGLGHDLRAMFVMMIVGLPVYVCATASVPVAAALIAKGVSPGAALVFLMTGPATNAATIATVWKTMGRRTAVTYLATVAVTAFAAGLLLNHIDPRAESMSHAGHSMLPPLVGTVAAVALLGVLGAALIAPLFERAKTPQPGEGDRMMTFVISGMTCSHCVDNVTRALGGLAGVKEVAVDLKGGRAVVTGDGLDEGELRRKVEEIGYEVTGVE
jgi:uncharacterized membrane protein YraQ (UPF0718 family)/copper chaperone CopZ